MDDGRELILFDGLTGPNDFYRRDNFGRFINGRFADATVFGTGDVEVEGKYDKRYHMTLFYIPSSSVVLEVKELGLGERSRKTSTKITANFYNLLNNVPQRFAETVREFERQHKKSLEEAIA